MIYLTLPDLIRVAERAISGDVQIRDHGLLQSALPRPQSTVFGVDAYPQLHEKAAALLHSLARNHALIDGNKRFALAATIAFLGINGQRLTLSNDGEAEPVVAVEAYNLIVSVAVGEVDDVAPIADRINKEGKPINPSPR